MTIDRHDGFNWLEVLELSLFDWQRTWKQSYPCHWPIWQLYKLWQFFPQRGFWELTIWNEGFFAWPDAKEVRAIQFQELIVLEPFHMLRWRPDSCSLEYNDIASWVEVRRLGWSAGWHTPFVCDLQQGISVLLVFHISLHAHGMHSPHMQCDSDNCNRHSTLWTPWVVDGLWRCANTSLHDLPSDLSQM